VELALPTNCLKEEARVAPVLLPRFRRAGRLRVELKLCSLLFSSAIFMIYPVVLDV